jgi:hypothetical protein
MSPLWTDMALARAAWAKAEDNDSVPGGKAKPQAERPFAARRPARRVFHRRLSSLAL